MSFHGLVANVTEFTAYFRESSRIDTLVDIKVYNSECEHGQPERCSVEQYLADIRKYDVKAQEIAHKQNIKKQKKELAQTRRVKELELEVERLKLQIANPPLLRKAKRIPKS